MPLGTLGKYERLDVLGHGVSGIVYLARDTMLNKQIALKEVDVQAGDMRRFLEEARVMDRLRHPNIVRVNNVDRIDNKVIIDMEYVRGQNLQELLRAEGALPIDRALDIAAQILDALHYAHEMQTVHRDIKPANILLSRDGQVKLVDFGLAEILATNAYAGGAGTYAYMAPEDFAEEDRSDHQSDIWAVGVTLFEMLTMQRPFNVSRVKDPFSWKRALENEDPAPLSDYLPDAPPGLQAILDHALAKNKRERYATAGEFRDDILRLRNGEAIALARLAPVQGNITERFAAEPRTVNGSTTKLPQFDIQENAVVTKSPPVVPPVPFSGPGTVVAEVVPHKGTEKENPATRSPFRRRKPAAVQCVVEPEQVDFGTVRKGDLRSTKIRIRVEGVGENVVGSIAQKPDWLTAHPMAFERSRQTITLTAHSGRTWETGEFHDTMTIKTEAGLAAIPLRLTVLRPRPTFWQVSFWYAPLYIAALLPALIVAAGGGGHALSTGAASLVAPAAVSSGLLALMLLLITIAADLGIAERVACSILLTVMCFALGIATAHTGSMNHNVLTTGGLIGLVLVLQCLYFSRWKFWAVALLVLSLFVSSTFWNVLGG